MFKQCSYHNVTVRVDHSSAPPTKAHTVWCVMSLEGSPHLTFTVYLHYYYYFFTLEHAMEYGLLHCNYKYPITPSKHYSFINKSLFLMSFTDERLVSLRRYIYL